jgi:hypothetical protein
MVARGHSIQRCCRILDVPESSFYAERSRVPSARSVRHAWVTDIERHEAFLNLAVVKGTPLRACRSRRVIAGGRPVALA